jgi:hypothetical protein
MPTLTIEYRDEAERLALEQAIAYVAQLRSVARDAPDGSVLDACEKLALADGRLLLRTTLAAALGGRIAAAEQKGGPPASAPPRTPGAPRAGARAVLTAVGPITLGRTYFTCPACGQGDFGADRVLGVEGYVTRGACRMACLLGVQQSFARAELALAEVAGWRLDDNSARKLCHAVAARATASRDERATAEAFAEARGDNELHVDAGKVNTLGGWRDVKVAVFGRRERGGRPRPRAGTSATCRPRRRGACWRRWRRPRRSASAAPGRRGGWG